MTHGVKKFFPAIVVALLIPAATPAQAWILPFSDSQGDGNYERAVAIDNGQRAPDLVMRQAGLESPAYRGWKASLRPEASASDNTASYASFVDFSEIDIVDADQAVAGTLIRIPAGPEIRFGMPQLEGRKWQAMRPSLPDGGVLPWEAVRRAKVWLGGAGATVLAQAKALEVAEPAALALMLAGLVPAIWLYRRRRASGP